MLGATRDPGPGLVYTDGRSPPPTMEDPVDQLGPPPRQRLQSRGPQGLGVPTICDLPPLRTSLSVCPCLFPRFPFFSSYPVSPPFLYCLSPPARPLLPPLPLCLFVCTSPDLSAFSAVSEGDSRGRTGEDRNGGLNLGRSFRVELAGERCFVDGWEGSLEVLCAGTGKT